MLWNREDTAEQGVLHVLLAPVKRLDKKRGALCVYGYRVGSLAGKKCIRASSILQGYGAYAHLMRPE